MPHVTSPREEVRESSSRQWLVIDDQDMNILQLSTSGSWQCKLTLEVVRRYKRGDTGLTVAVRSSLIAKLI